MLTALSFITLQRLFFQRLSHTKCEDVSLMTLTVGTRQWLRILAHSRPLFTLRPACNATDCNQNLNPLR